MKTVRLKGVTVGEGRPKICVPIVGVTEEEILAQAERFSQIPADIAEWRADWFGQVSDLDKVRAILKKLRGSLKETPLLFTFRTRQEGGECELTKDSYAELLKEAAASEMADMVDVEVFSGDELVKDIVEQAHGYGVKVIASNHDFEKTPEKEEILSRLCKMQELGADIAKIAVMPNSKQDMLTLLSATEEMHGRYAEGPIVTMAMGADGVLSRICGEAFGSAITFGSAGKASAPGQIDVRELDKLLELIHKNI